MKERWEQWRAIALVALVVAMIGSLAACGKFKSSPKDQARYIVGDAAIGCLFVPKAQVAKALDAHACAQEVLKLATTTTTIDLPAVERCAARVGLPDDYTFAVALLLERVRVHLGADTGPLIPVDSDVGYGLQDFFTTCGKALESVARRQT